MIDSIQNALPYITGTAFVVALLLALVAFRLFRYSRTDTLWRKRRSAGQRGWRLLVLAFILFIISGLSCLFILLATLVFTDPETPPSLAENTGNTSAASQPLPTETILSEVERSPTDLLSDEPETSPMPTQPSPTPPPGEVVVITTAPIYTPTETPFPTFTPHVTPLASDITPLPDATITITALDDQISDALIPLNPRTTFEAGTNRIYLFVEFKNMTQGVLWERVLFRDGEKIDGNSYLWGLETNGTGYFFFGNDNGFTPGNYEIRLSLGNEQTPANNVSFTIIEAP